MSLAVSPGWIPPVLTITLVVLLELISDNIVEPLLSRLFCFPVTARPDELAGKMLANLLHRKGLNAQVAPSTLVSGELVGWVEEAGAETVLLTGVAPTTLYQVRYLCLKLHIRFPELRIVVALCDAMEGELGARLALHECGADEVVTSIREGAARVAVLAAAMPARPVLELRG